jgi:hypothetical protein
MCIIDFLSMLKETSTLTRLLSVLAAGLKMRIGISGSLPIHTKICPDTHLTDGNLTAQSCLQCTERSLQF